MDKLTIEISRAVGEILAQVDKYRFKRMFASRTEAIEVLLKAGLKVNPANPKVEKE